MSAYDSIKGPVLLSKTAYLFKFSLSVRMELVDCDDHGDTKQIGIFNLFPQVTKTLFDQVKIFV